MFSSVAVVNLTLIDLPGLTKVAVGKHQAASLTHACMRGNKFNISFMVLFSCNYMIN